MRGRFWSWNGDLTSWCSLLRASWKKIACRLAAGRLATLVTIRLLTHLRPSPQVRALLFCLQPRLLDIQHPKYLLSLAHNTFIRWLLQGALPQRCIQQEPSECSSFTQLLLVRFLSKSYRRENGAVEAKTDTSNVRKRRIYPNVRFWLISAFHILIQRYGWYIW